MPIGLMIVFTACSTTEDLMDKGSELIKEQINSVSFGIEHKLTIFPLTSGNF